MSLLVPYDGSTLAQAALRRADAFGTVFDEPVVAVSVIPEGNTSYARERGWLGPEDSYDRQRIVTHLHDGVTELVPAAHFRYVMVDRYAPTGTIAKRLRRIAREESASMVFVGSENVGRIATGLSTVGGTVAADDAYDVVIVRRDRPTALDAIRESDAERRQQ